ncbi:hypothetical protein ACFX16_032388 [Malus domestica]
MYYVMSSFGPGLHLPQIVRIRASNKASPIRESITVRRPTEPHPIHLEARGLSQRFTIKVENVNVYRNHCTFLCHGGTLLQIFSKLMGRKDDCSKEKGGLTKSTGCR